MTTRFSAIVNAPSDYSIPMNAKAQPVTTQMSIRLTGRLGRPGRFLNYHLTAQKTEDANAHEKVNKKGMAAWN
jgi:hypothetical protein